MIDDEHQELLAQVAEMYYFQDLNQAAIAKELFFSRSKVSRLLTEARESGLVEIVVRHPLRRALQLETKFSDKYQLKNAIILKTGNLKIEQMMRSLGRLGARYLTENLEDGDILGISWGTAVYEVAKALRPKRLEDFEVVQIIGSIGYGDPSIDGPEVARHIALTFGGRYYTLNAPVIVHDRNARDSLLKDRNIREVILKSKKADYILVGIGSSCPGRSGLVRAGYLFEEELNQINEQTGAVGDICACLFNQDGKYRDIRFNDRIVGISLDEIKTIPAETIGIAGGEEKAAAVLGALRGRLIDTLITDEKAAQKVLAIDS